jgi:hypothetical protein
MVDPFFAVVVNGLDGGTRLARLFFTRMTAQEFPWGCLFPCDGVMVQVPDTFPIYDPAAKFSFPQIAEPCAHAALGRTDACRHLGQRPIPPIAHQSEHAIQLF